MTKMTAFDLNNNILEGVNLIEASAGTGKTYTIAGLYLRLVVEKRIPVEKILVVTFTDAATQELKERIRNRLKDALTAYGEPGSDDPLLSKLVNTSENVQMDLECLEDAIRSFDQAAIFTIHGFCQRMLVENAFESGSLFDAELVSNNDELMREVVLDFWRTNMYEISPLFAEYLSVNKVRPETLVSFVSGGMKPGIRIVPDVILKDSMKEEEDFLRQLRNTSELWQGCKKQVEQLLVDDPGLNRTKYNKKKIPEWVTGLNSYLTSEDCPLTLPDKLEKFSSASISGAVKKGNVPAVHPFFDMVHDLIKAYELLAELFANNLLSYKIMAVFFVKNQLTIRKQEKSILGFDDLLIHLHKGLTGENGPALSENIQRKFSVALIDEFQDTDPIQYDIFLRIFGTASSTLFMIGDPKQAIYGFRGADIFAYIKAANNVESAFTLAKNYRSDPGIIHAVNTIFHNADSPFVFDEIRFYPAEAANLENSGLLELSQETDTPFHLWMIETDDKMMAKNEASRIVLGAVTVEISRLLNLGLKGEAMLSERPLKEKDIAVLVRTNKEAAEMKDALNTAGIPAVIYNTGNVFHSFEAMELERVLTAIVRPGNNGLVRAALATEMLGVYGDQIAGFEEHPEKFEVWKSKFRYYHEVWNKFGLINVFNLLIKNETVLVRLMGYGDGDRRNTNLLHLSQLLHQAGLEENLGPEGLIKWLNIQRDPNTPSKEEHQLRLESDADTVKIVTIHKSKGLEYPVVFCPYTWSGRGSRAKPEFCVFHDKDENGALTLDAGSEEFDESLEISAKEELAEDLRLLYVALTRAKSRCYMIWGRVKGAEKTAAGYLFHQSENQVMMPKDDTALMKRLADISDKSEGTISVRAIEEKEAQVYNADIEKPEELVMKKFQGTIDSDYRITSFSSLAQKKNQIPDEADRDASVVKSDLPERKDRSETPDIFSFPKGAGPGTFMHEIFEHYDFTSDESILEELVDDKLNVYGYESSWKDTICGMVNNVLHTPLEPLDQDFILADVKPENRLNELEFYFPLKHIRPEELEHVFFKHSVPGFSSTGKHLLRTGRLDFSPVKGFIKGFIDMIFRRQQPDGNKYYIVDWKSNWLGNSISDYGSQNLLSIMAEDLYVLQYHLYSVALNRYLSLRVGDDYNYTRNFGGIYYIFLRGTSPAAGPEFGIFRDIPSENLIHDLDALLFQEQ